MTSCIEKRVILTGANSGGNLYNNTKVDEEGALNVSVKNPLDAFGDLVCNGLTPISQIHFVYNLQPSLTETFTSYACVVEMNQKGSIGTAQVQSIYLPAGSFFKDSGTANYFTLEDGGGNAFYVWFDVDSGNTDPSVAGSTGIEVSILSSDTNLEVATKSSTAIGGNAAFSTTIFGNIVIITNATSTSSDPRSIELISMPATSPSTLIQNNGLLECKCGSGIGDYAVLRSKRNLRYRPGIGSIARFTALYDTPSAGTLQYSGISNSVCGLYFGYDSSGDFGISYRNSGKHTLYDLTIGISTPSTGTVNVRIDGIDNLINITNVSSKEIVARQIASHDFRGSLHLTEVIGDKIIFSSERLNTNVDLFAFSLGTATGITGTFVKKSSAVAQTDTLIKQTDWNIDKMDGNGPSGMILDPSKGNVFEITYQYLGFGKITFFIEDENTGLFQKVHVIKYTNQNLLPSLINPGLALTYFTTTTISNISKTIKGASGAQFISGNERDFSPFYSHGNSHLDIGEAESEEILFAIKNSRWFENKGNQSELIFKNISASTGKSANNTKCSVTFIIKKGGTPSAGLNFSYIDEGNSVAQIASPSPGNTLTNGTTIWRGSLSAEGNFSYSLDGLDLFLEKSEVLYLLHSNTNPSTGTVDVSCNINWVESQ